VVHAVLACGTAVFVLGSSLAWLYVYVLIYGLAFGARSPLRASVMAAHFGRRSYGPITAALGLIVSAPSALGPLPTGWLYDRLGNYQVTFWLAVAAFAVASTTLLLTPRPKRHGKEPAS